MERILVVGSSGHARVVADTVERGGTFEIAGVVDDYRPRGEPALGSCVVGGVDDLAILMQRHSATGVLVAIGDNAARARVVDRIGEAGFASRFVTAIHPRATVARDVCIGEGTVVMAGSVINANCTIGRFCILNTNSSLDHDSRMSDFSSLAPSACTGGDCRIGAFASIGIGATLINGVRIGDDTVVGACALVNAPIGPNVVAYGVPARVVRARIHGDKYL